MSKAYGLWNADRGTSNRAVIIVDKEGVVRFRHEYTAPALPEPADILAEVKTLG
jgi:alkyl hydroperoxide reductase subunit AhpC